jgi:hypothetical protein
MGRLRAASRVQVILAVALLVACTANALSSAAGTSSPTAAAGGTGQGYWLAGADGSVYPFGSAVSYGSLVGKPLGHPIAALTPAPSGRGYWLVGTDGGVFAFGDAPFYGSTGNLRLNKPIVGMAPTPLSLGTPQAPGGKGYWFVASDGGVFAFGDAPFYGSTGNLRQNKPIVGMAPTPTGKGYWFVASDGGIFNFGDAAFSGAAGDRAAPGAVIGMAASVPAGGTTPGPGALTPSVPTTAPPPTTEPTGTTNTTAPAPIVPSGLDPFDIGLVGDTGYYGGGVHWFGEVVEQMNRFPLAFVVHDGDFKDPTSPCTDERFAQAATSFNRSTHPFVFAPGDNEWMDCADDPVGRLATLRQMFFSSDTSLGRTGLPLTTQRQRGYPENARWIRGGVVFATLNVPGPNDDLPNADESGPRRVANVDWLGAAFDTARAGNAPAVMIIWQADPTVNGFDNSFKYLVNELKQRAEAFGKPVVLVHGDTHTYRIDQPWPEVPNLTRVETHALVDNNYWIRATVDPSDPKVFTFTDEHVG